MKICDAIRSLSRDGGGAWRLRILAADQARIDEHHLFKQLESKAAEETVTHPDLQQLSVRNSVVLAAHNEIQPIRGLVGEFGELLMNLAAFEDGVYVQYADELRKGPSADAQLLQKVEVMQRLTAAVHQEAVLY